MCVYSCTYVKVQPETATLQMAGPDNDTQCKLAPHQSVPYYCFTGETFSKIILVWLSMSTPVHE